MTMFVPAVILVSEPSMPFNFTLSAALILPAALVEAGEIEMAGVVEPVATEIGDMPETLVTVPVVGVDHCGAVAPEFIVNTCPAVPFARRVPVPLVPP